MTSKTWRDRLREMLKRHEGLELKPYQCTANRWTVGYGHNLEAHGKERMESITLEEAERFLDEDIAAAESMCRTRMPYYDDLDDVRKAVLVDMCFNLGIGGLMGFKKTLGAVAEKQYGRAAVEMLNSKWATQVGRRAKRLSEMMAFGKWPEE